MPTPTTNCHDCALAPIQPGNSESAAAAAQPNSSGTPSASPAVIPLSRRLLQALRTSSSMPAIITNSITAHQATPLSAAITSLVKTAA